jgi:hypothetical protein
MKKIVFVLTLAMGSAITMANVNANNEIGTEVSTGESFKLINDTKQKISIHTGTGFVSLEKGSSTYPPDQLHLAKPTCIADFCGKITT